MRISIKEFARRTGVSYNAVLGAVGEGRVTRGNDGLIDWEAGLKELQENSSISNGSESIMEDLESSEKPKLTFAAARTKNEILKSEVNQIKIRQLNEELVEKEEAKKVFYRKVKELRDALQNWPARVSSQIASELESDPHTTNVVLEKYIYEFLLDFSKEEIGLNTSTRNIVSA